MGGKQSSHDNTDPESAGIGQNKKKIYGMSKLISVKADHQRTVASKGWDKHDNNMVCLQ